MSIEKVRPLSDEEGTEHELTPIEQVVATKVATAMGLELRACLQVSDLFSSGLDSFAFMQLVTELEEQYSISFDENDLLSSAFKTVRGTAELVQSKLGSN